ncbi:MAG: transposase [bacterium]
MNMIYDPKKHHRRSIRLKGYDYSQPGAYFITVCSQNRECIFGTIQDDKMILNRFGQVVEEKWNNIPKHFPHTRNDTLGVMPNHIHGIIFIIDLGAKHSMPNFSCYSNNTILNASPLQGRPRGTKSGSLSANMQNYLSVTTRKINQLRRTPGAQLWQRNYYKHIIRNEKDLNKIREYIIHNALKWELDRNHPNHWK